MHKVYTNNSDVGGLTRPCTTRCSTARLVTMSYTHGTQLLVCLLVCLSPSSFLCDSIVCSSNNVWMKGIGSQAAEIPSCACVCFPRLHRNCIVNAVAKNKIATARNGRLEDAEKGKTRQDVLDAMDMQVRMRMAIMRTTRKHVCRPR